jgi:predicted DNA binding CopG/RHH family protein
MKWKPKQKGEPDLETSEFKSEAEEAEWWFANREKIADRLIKYGRKAPIETQPVTIRLPKTDISRARLLAKKRGMPYQTFIKAVLHENLRKLSA